MAIYKADQIDMVELAGQLLRMPPKEPKEPNPYESLAWRTALRIVKERLNGAKENARIMGYDDYFKGRRDALQDLMEELEERTDAQTIR